jgi:hypothetical protein
MQTVQIDEEREEQASEHKAQNDTQAGLPSMQDHLNHKMRSKMRESA